MQPGDLDSVLRVVAGGVGADALAVGVSLGSRSAFRCRGRVAGEDVSPATVFYGASVTKQLIGYLLADAVAAGRASTADRVRRWLPELPSWTDGVRLRHLLHHTGDLPDVTAPRPAVPAGNDEVIERLAAVHPVAPIAPGRRFRYNNTGYVLLAEVVARIRGQAIEQAATTALFDPLGLGNTRLGGDPIELSGTPAPPGTVGDGGLWTSVADLTSWLAALDHGPLDPGVVRKLQTPGRFDDGSPVDYAWGVRVTPTRRGIRVTHGGSWGTWLAKTVRVPDRDVAVAVLSTGGTEAAISDTGIRLASVLADL